MSGEPVALDPEAYAELVSRLVSLRRLADGLVVAFVEERSAQGAEEMLASIDRALDLLGYRGDR